MTKVMSPSPLLASDIYPILTQEKDQPWSHHGRFGRLSYMAWMMMTLLVTIALMTLMFVIGAIAGITTAHGISLGVTLIGALCFIPSVYLMIIFQIRRLHDLNHSGWWVSLPLVNGILAQFMIILAHSVNLGLVLTGASLIIHLAFSFYLMISEGTDGMNDYGERRLTPVWEKITGLIAVVMSAIGLICLTLTAIPAYQSYQKQTAMMHLTIQSSYPFPEHSLLQ